MSDPRDESRWSADDLISMGALNTPEVLARLQDTPALRDLNLDDFDALVVCGGQRPMFQFRDHEGSSRRSRHGKTMTGFADVEEDFGDAAVGQTVMPYRIGDEARKRGANDVQPVSSRPSRSATCTSSRAAAVLGQEGRRGRIQALGD